RVRNFDIPVLPHTFRCSVPHLISRRSQTPPLTAARAPFPATLAASHPVREVNPALASESRPKSAPPFLARGRIIDSLSNDMLALDLSVPPRVLVVEDERKTRDS